MSSISSPLSTPTVNLESSGQPARERRGLAYLGLLLFLFLLSAPLQNAIPALDAVKPVQAVAVVALVAALMGKLSRREALVLRWPSYLMIALMAISGLSVMGAMWPGEAFRTTLDAFKILAIFLLISNVVVSPRKLNGVAWALCLGGLAPALGTIKNYFAGENLVDGFRAVWVGIYGNPNDLAYTLAMLVPLAMGLISSTRRTSAKLIAVGCIGLYTLAIFFTFSRMGFLCLLVILLMMLLRSQHRVRNFMLIAILAMLCLPFVPDRYWERIETIPEYEKDTSAEGRFVAWEAVFDMLNRHPMLGVGAGCYILGWTDDLKEKYGIPPRTAHNTFVQALGELGILGFLTFCAFLLSSWGLLWHLKRTLLTRRRSLAPEVFNAHFGQLLAMVTALDIGFWVYIVASLTGGLLFSWFPYLFSAMGVAAQEIYIRDQESGVRDQDSNFLIPDP